MTAGCIAFSLVACAAAWFASVAHARTATTAERAACEAKVQPKLDWIESRLRAGYSVREGETLRAQKRKLEEQIARMDTEAVASQAAFRAITEQAVVRDLFGLDLVETADGAVLTEEAATEAAEQAQAAEAAEAGAEVAEAVDEEDEQEVERPRRAA